MLIIDIRTCSLLTINTTLYFQWFQHLREPPVYCFNLDMTGDKLFKNQRIYVILYIKLLVLRCHFFGPLHFPIAH